MAIIHLLDDDLRVTRACAFLLESLGYEVMCWAEGEMFLAQANLYQAGVVLLDMRMPGLDGRGVHEALRQSGSTLGVVFLTGHGDVPMAVEQMKQGAVDFLQKPVLSSRCRRRWNVLWSSPWRRFHGKEFLGTISS